MSVLIGLDVGTGGARAVAVDESGEIVAEASSEYPLHSPHPGWTEQDPDDWWEGAKEVLENVATRDRGAGSRHRAHRADARLRVPGFI